MSLIYWMQPATALKCRLDCVELKTQACPFDAFHQETVLQQFFYLVKRKVAAAKTKTPAATFTVSLASPAVPPPSPLSPSAAPAPRPVRPPAHPS
jgi:hypothetical protein